MTIAVSIVAFLVLLLLVFIFAAVSAVVHHVPKIADDMHVTRAGVNSIRSRFRAMETTVNRLENHVRGPGRKYGPPPAVVSTFDTRDIEPNL